MIGGAGVKKKGGFLVQEGGLGRCLAWGKEVGAVRESRKKGKERAACPSQRAQGVRFAPGSKEGKQGMRRRGCRKTWGEKVGILGRESETMKWGA